MTDILALRVERPYSSESEFLRAESWTITRKSVFLIGVPTQPEGAVARCELVLSTGIRLLVAEGVVAKHVSASAERPAGLVLRYRRMTPASSLFVNRALSNREAGEASSPSAAEHGPVIGMVNGQETEAMQAPIANADPAPGTMAKLNTERQGHRGATEILQRLSGRERKKVESPLNRATVLSRLRVRAARDSNR